MPITAFLLVAFAALAHASWNLLAKRASHSQHLIWFSSAIEALLFAPLAIFVLAKQATDLHWRVAEFLVATGVLHLIYTEVLLRGYRVSDLSVVYPVARGTGPLLSFFGAVALLHEHLSLLAVTGALLISVGILTSAGGKDLLRQKDASAGLLWGLSTGFTIACYTLVDAYSVKVLLISPVLVEYAGNLVRAAVLSISRYRRRASLAVEFRACWREAFGIAVLTPAGYILVLFAMRLAPVSHIAPVREMSIIIGVFLGTRFLSEGNLARRILGAAFVASGVIALAF